ncbi:MAG: ABC transporter ATP-binding protein [Actinomycetes bacterium]
MGLGSPGREMMRAIRHDQGVGKRHLAPGTVPRIIAFARPYRRSIGVYLALVVIDAALVVAAPLLLREIIDRGVLAHNGAVVVRLSLVVAGLAVLAAGISLVQRWYSARIGEGLIYDLRTRVFHHVQEMPVAFFTRTQTGALISRLNNDVIGAQQAFTSTLSGVVSNVVSFVLVVAAMAVLSWQITVASMLLLPVFLLPARWVGRRLQTLARRGMALNADMSTSMSERFNVAGAMLVKLFGRPEQEDASFSSRAAGVRDIGVRQAMLGRVFLASLTLVTALATALVYGLGGVYAARGEIQVGTLVALTALLGRLYGPMTALSNVQVDVMTALVSFERVFEVLDLTPMVADRPGALPLPDPGPAGMGVAFDHVSFHYPSAQEVSLASLESVAVLDQAPSVPVLQDVSFVAPAGQMTALVGPSGAGKTTIAALVARFYDPTVGVVRIGGVDIREATQLSVRQVVGVVTQDAHMFHDTIRANLLYARPEAGEAELVQATRAAQIWPLIAGLPDGLDTVVGDRGYRLSGGEKQRLAIARLLLKAPSIVVLDEATAHLDSESEAGVQAALAYALTGRTSLVIAHRLSTIRAAQQILVVDDGRIVARGTHEQLLEAGGLYADLYRTQFAAGEHPAASTPV